MKSFSKRVASFTMAAAMVLSLAAVSPVDAQAAKKASITKKTSITAGKTYTYKIKNVTSKQYVKVTGITSGVKVKYNNKTVKKNSTKIYGKKSGAALALKVTAKDKVANYKATIKAQVYNKSNNKKVGSLLKTTATVKCTKLAIKSVEPATLAANNYKYVVVNFNRALDSLDPSEVIIRKKDTNELVTVEKVALASNGKSATLTLLGDALTATGFLKENTDYVLTLDKAGATASMEFNFPAVKANSVVDGVDAGKRTITVGGAKYTVPTTITVDFQDILGRTITFWHNKNNDISKLVVANETVVYGAFGTTYDATNNVWTYASKTSDDKYVTVATTSGTIYATATIKAAAKSIDAIVDKTDVAYAKLVLNPNGTIRTAVYEKNMNSKLLVASVAGNVVTESKDNAANLLDYTIVKDGKTVAITDLQAGDVVIYNAADKFAEVYTNKVTGVVTAVTDKKVTIAGASYDYANDAKVSFAKYVEGNATKPADADYFVSLKAAAKDAVVYLDRFGKVAYASGDKGVVATTSREVIVKGDTKAYTLGLESYIQLSASDATDVAVPEIKLSELKTVKTAAGTWTKDDVADTTKLDSVNSFKFDASNKLTDINVTPKGEAAIDIPFSPVLGNVVTLTLDSSSSKVVGIEVKSNTTTLKAGVAFEKGKATIEGADNKSYQIVSSTPVFEINKDKVVSKTTYGEYAKKTKDTQATKVLVYADGGNVAKIVIDDSNKDDSAYGVTDTADIRGIVVAKETLKDEVVTYTIVSEGKEVTYTSFEDGVKKAAPAVGSLVKITYEKSSNKVTAFAGEAFDPAVDGTKVANGKINDCDLASSVTPTIVYNDGNGNKVITYGELTDVVASKGADKVNVVYHTMADKIIDYVYVTLK